MLKKNRWQSIPACQLWNENCYENVPLETGPGFRPSFAGILLRRSTRNKEIPRGQGKHPGMAPPRTDGIRRNAPGASCQSLTHRYKTGYFLYWNGFRFWRSRPGLRNGQPRRGRGRSASRARGKYSRCSAKRTRAKLPKGFRGDGGVRRLDDRGNQEAVTDWLPASVVDRR